MTFEEATSYLPKDVKTVENVQTELRMLIRDAVLKGMTDSEIATATQKVIGKYLDEIESVEIRLRAAEALPKFSAKILRQMRSLVESAKAAMMLAKPKTPKSAEKMSRIIRGATDEEFLAVLNDDDAYNVEINDRAYFIQYQKKVERALANILATQAKPQYSSRVNLRNIAEMTVRYERQKEHLDSIRQGGERLVWIEPHANCSKRCEPWQGRLFSLDGTSGRIEGIPYVPIEAATDQFYTTKTGRTYKNGCITGYNCRHKTIPFKGAQSRPDTIPASIVEKKRKEEERQRSMERRIRYEREKALFLKGIDPRASAASALKVKKMLAIYERYSRKVNLPRMDGRTKIAQGEGRIQKDIPKILNSLARRAQPASP